MVEGLIISISFEREGLSVSPMRQVYQSLKFTKSELSVLGEGKGRLLVLLDFLNENEYRG